MKLYHYWRSSCSWRVRWGLEIKGVSYKPIAVNLLKNEQNEESYKTMSPLGLVPTLVIESGNYATESLAILEWLEEMHPTPSFYVDQTESRRKIRELAQIVAIGTQPLQNLHVLKKIMDLEGDKMTWGHDVIESGLRAYESRLVDWACSGDFSFGDQVSLADLCLIPQVYNALRFSVDVSRFPNIERIYKNARELESCKKASPESFEPNP